MQSLTPRIWSGSHRQVRHLYTLIFIRIRIRLYVHVLINICIRRFLYVDIGVIEKKSDLRVQMPNLSPLFTQVGNSCRYSITALPCSLTLFVYHHYLTHCFTQECFVHLWKWTSLDQTWAARNEDKLLNPRTTTGHQNTTKPSTCKLSARW